jgi:hypothetical protein
MEATGGGQNARLDSENGGRRVSIWNGLSPPSYRPLREVTIEAIQSFTATSGIRSMIGED